MNHKAAAIALLFPMACMAQTPAAPDAAASAAPVAPRVMNYYDPPDLQRRSFTPPKEECMPKEAGGQGVNFTATHHADGMVYTWHCALPDGGYERKFIAAHNRDNPKTPLDPKELRMELSRLNVLHGYAGDAGVFMVREGQNQLSSSDPLREKKKAKAN